MTRPKEGSGRTTDPAAADEEYRREIPSFRKRKPLTFWVVIIAVAAMALSVVVVPLSILLS